MHVLSRYGRQVGTILIISTILWWYTLGCQTCLVTLCFKYLILVIAISSAVYIISSVSCLGWNQVLVSTFPHGIGIMASLDQVSWNIFCCIFHDAFPRCFSAYYMITLIRIMLLILVIPVLICCWTFDILKLINSSFQDLEVRPLRVENLLYRWVFKEFIENNDDKDGENDLLFLSLVQRLA